ncbi:hypothetical protein TcG_10242, partial [Trypanosoma cruzi]
QPSSASKSCWCWCVSGVESPPVASSQGIDSRSRVSALHSRQRHHARTAYTTKETQKSTAAIKHGKKGSTSIYAFRLAHRHTNGGRVAALRCVWRVTAVDGGMMRGVGDAVRSSSISVNCDTGDAFPSDRLQQRPSPSAAVGAFPLPLGRNSTNAVARLLPHQHTKGAAAKDETRTASAQSQSPTAAAMAKQRRLQDAKKRRINTPPKRFGTTWKHRN